MIDTQTWGRERDRERRWFEAARVVSQALLARLLRPLGLVLVALGAVLVGFAWWVAQEPMPIRQIELEMPLSGPAAADVRRVLGQVREQGFLQVRVNAVRRALESLEWVERARVRRAWPAGLRVQVWAQVPVARWGQRALLNARGEVFRPDSVPEAVGLVALAGPPGQASKVLARYREMAGLLSGTGLAIDRLDLDARRAWSLELANGVQVELGRERPVVRWRRLLRVFAGPLRRHGAELERVDVRYTNGFAVRWRNERQPLPAEGAA